MLIRTGSISLLFIIKSLLIRFSIILFLDIILCDIVISLRPVIASQQTQTKPSSFRNAKPIENQNYSSNMNIKNKNELFK
ncbi:hypothetical protein BpHYR1_036773 [Brachionus plicatilis]|uniref:Uncharacterized protein n=1 Tax=Brachionus plicatilis TaxID=10195 RepID=A0A3M7T042_BRAPC|nr:hypothetical protein BpHYR1_036773 [Brachionus plicatilis]